MNSKKKNDIKPLIGDSKTANNIKLTVEGFVTAGFPSPAGDYIDNELNLKTLLIKNESSTFFVQVTGNSMQDANIFDGDILVVDKSLNPSKDSILVCFIDGEFTVKRVSKVGKDFFLIPANKEFNPIKIEEGSDFRLWGVVTYVIHKVR
ncbi:MAG: LexA family protein [Bacteroidales bacterium]